MSTNQRLRHARRFDVHFIRYPDRIVFPASFVDDAVTPLALPGEVESVGGVCDDMEYVRRGLASSESDEVMAGWWKGGLGVTGTGRGAVAPGIAMGGVAAPSSPL